ncbi:hypothetical protein [Christiangramia forsetii]|uniref:Membrane protein n=2 Tax=Christiangramia forsetii TaxID=411153 RepID=A0M4G9_CHRFK|nr:hypothetical protein [Christiangramia forsetii]GGG23468.1 hypothetical protein GCM10011532_03240 [Christiangramia forsetii]CAL67514.1 membrane protein [Christiangramia forsetii KT0803]
MKTTRLLIILLIVGVILLIPFIAMQLGAEGVDWDSRDFMIMGILLLGTALALEFSLQKIKTTKKRFIACGLILIGLFLIWAELAVGIFGTPFAGE